MLEWLEVRLDVGCDKRLVYEYRIEPLKCDRDALKQECRLACIACSGTQPPTHLSIIIPGNEKVTPRFFAVFSGLAWNFKVKDQFTYTFRHFSISYIFIIQHCFIP